MPGGNRTGPAGMGPMTGRGAGFCAGFGAPGYANPAGGRGYFGRGRGMGRGRGFGRGFGFSSVAGAGAYPENVPFVQTLTATQELEGLKQQAELLQSSLGQISDRIEQLEKENKK